MLYILLGLTILFFILFCVSIYFVIKFARIIMSFEDQLEKALEIFDETHKSIGKVLELRLFFDSKEIADAVKGVMDNLNLSRLALYQLIQQFTKFSKNKYVVYIEDDEFGITEEENLSYDEK